MEKDSKEILKTLLIDEGIFHLTEKAYGIPVLEE